MPDLDKRLDEIEKKLDSISSSPYPIFGNQVLTSDDEIDLRELWNVIWGGKWIIIATTFVFAAASVVYALSLPNIYKSEALLAPAEENSGGGLAGLAGQFGGLASLAGVNIGSSGSDKTVLAIEVLKSRDFITKFIETHDIVVPLMAAKNWDAKSNTLVLDSDVFDSEAKVWVRKVRFPKERRPTLQEAFYEFTDLFEVNQDKATKFVTVSVKFYSPHVAKRWVNWLVEDINTEIKLREVLEAKRSIEYLLGQLEKTSIADMQSIFYELIEEQTKTIMFAEVREEYVFKTVDPPVSPIEKFKPRRILICLFGSLLGFIVAISSVLARFFIVKELGCE